MGDTDLAAAIELLRVRDAQGALAPQDAAAIRVLLDHIDQAGSEAH